MDPVEYKTNDVRSNELETGLSSNAESLNQVVDTTVSKLPSSSSSRPLHALSESCSLKESQLKGLGRDFSFPKVPPLGCLAWVRKLATLLTGKFVFMRLTFCVAFNFPSIRSSYTS